MTAELWVRFLVGCIVGGGVVWSSVIRTLAVHKLDYKDAMIGSVANSVAYYWSIHFIAKDDFIAYMGTAVGSTIIILYMILKNKRTK